MTPSPLRPTLAALAGVRRRVLVHRRGLAALLTALAVLLALRAAREPLPSGVPVLAARHDLAAGAVLTGDDVRTVEVDPVARPDGALVDSVAVVGHALAAPVRAGETLTDLRLVSTALHRAYPGRVVVPVRLGDADAVRLLHPGDVVDVVAGDSAGSDPPRVVATAARVVEVPRPSAELSGTSGSGALAVLAVDRQEAAEVSVAGDSRYLGVVFTP